MSSVRRVWQFFKPSQNALIGSILLGSVTLISSTALMATSGWLISRAAQMPPVLTLSIAVVGVRTFALARGVSRYAERLLSHNATFNSLNGLHRVIFDKLEQLAPAGLPAFRRGDLLARLVADVDSVQDLPLRVILPISAGVLSASFAIGLSAWLLPAAGLVMLITLLFAATVIPLIAIKNAAKTEMAVANIRGELIDELIEFYSGSADIISLGQERVALKRLISLDAQLTESASKQSFTTGLAAGLLTLAQGTALIVSTVIAIEAHSAGKLDGVLLAVLAMIPMAAFESVSNFPAAALVLSRVRGSAERIFEILDKEIVVQEPIESKDINKAVLNLENISANWPNSDRSAITNVTFQLPIGGSIGLVGPSGSGKSTVLSVLIKFLNPKTGIYEVDNISSINLSGKEIREHLILSSPEQHIFATSIAENLRIASERPNELTDEHIWWALEKVDLANWVRTLPNQLSEVIGERGSTMSGGQRQRLTLARLFIANPDVWILDEPTEHLDSALADRIMNQIFLYRGHSSLIVASHRSADTQPLEQVIKIGHLD